KPAGSPSPAAVGSPSPSPAASPVAQAATPAPTTLPAVPADTATVATAHVDIPPVSGKTGSFDIMEIDQDAHLLYVADRTDSGVDLFDVSTPTAKYLRTIDTGSPPNGLSLAKNVNKVFTGNND